MAHIKEDLTGRTFGRLTVLGHVTENGSSGWRCRCSCDKQTILIVPTNSLTSGHVRSCGCLRSELVKAKFTSDLIGKTFGRLTVIGREGSDIHGNALWACKCSCGNDKISYVTSTALLTGRIKSCGCLRAEMLATMHVKYPDPDVKYLAIRKFSSMKDRCLNPNCKAYPDWGGRGITICQEWLDDPKKFAEWALSHGWKKGLSIDRIDNNGPYSPENCRFVTDATQSINKRNNRWIEVNGERKTISQWAEVIGVPRINLYHKTDERVKKQVEKALGSAAKE